MDWIAAFLGWLVYPLAGYGIGSIISDISDARFVRKGRDL